MGRTLRRVALIACIAGAVACSSPLPDGGRYSTRVGTTGATVVWTSRRADRVVCRGADGASHAATATTSAIGLRVARFDDLRADAPYRCTFPGERTPLRFRTAPDGDAPFRFAVVGDS